MCFVTALGVLIVLRPQAVLEGVRSGLETSVGVVVPSLFPFLVISSFAAKVSATKFFEPIAAPIMRCIFRLPPQALPAVAFGLVGGFPVGCSVASQLYSDGKISREQAQRLSLFCVNPGPAFTVTAVGAVMLGSTKAGWIMFAALSLAALTVGAALRFIAPKPDAAEYTSETDMPFSAALVEATERSAVSIIKICAWVTLFASVFSLLSQAKISPALMSALRCILEVTGGCAETSKTGNIYTVAATLGWSGLCVICQIMGDVKKIGTPIGVLLAFRAVHAGLATVICCGLLKLFPLETSVFLTFTGAAGGEFFSTSAPAAVALLGLCAVFVIDLDRTRKMC